jgi:TRAP-type transport system periplasmic protein
MERRGFLLLLTGLLAALASAAPARAQEVTLRVHHFLPPSSVAHEKFIKPWAGRLERQSQGRIAVQVFPAMQLGGQPPQLYDQARDGVADIVWTLPSYTPGRFPVSEVFELPFLPGTAEATSQALQDFADRHLRGEFGDVHPLLFHVHAPGSIHTRDRAVATVEDMKGLKLRSPTRGMTGLMETLGAVSVGMPAPGVPEALSRGVLDGMAFPYEVVLPLRAHEMVGYHAEIPGLYTSVFLLAMNKARYEGLPADLRKVIDDNSGMALAREIGRLYDEAEAPGRQAALERGNRVVRVEGAELERFRKAARPVTEAWISRMKERGIDGAALLEEARELIGKHGAAR